MTPSTSRIRRAAACAAPVAAVTAALCAAASAPAPREAAALPFTVRYHAVQRGGIARAANTATRCLRAVDRRAAPCPSVDKGAAGVNGQYQIRYADLDHDRNTYNSTRASLRLPRGAQVAYARLYWGANLRVGEQKPSREKARVLVAEPGGQYKEVRADTVVGHRVNRQADAYQASADVTRLVRAGGPGSWTVAQVDVAMGHSAAGAWGGWTLVAAYQDRHAPRRHLVLWDGFRSPDPWTGELTVTVPRTRTPAGARGRVGIVGYDGDRGAAHRDSLTLATGAGPAVALADRANPVDDILNSTISEGGRHTTARKPAHRNTLGYDSDVIDARRALHSGGDHLTLRFVSAGDDHLLGAVFAQVDAAR
ncbi:DUF3344 domain-containing protein [Streptomyces sp. NPDC059740]|uniref:DUF3344 domain-containing protein n=1 Tax=Streptomyces sp. NPDC059740 TaxID=3346926 RepID=UPI00365D423A